MIRIDDQVAIPEEALRFSTARSGGPGGQNVNKVESQVIVEVTIDQAEWLTPEQRQLIAERLANRINRDGVLQVRSSRHRTQGANRKAAVERLGELLAEALAVDPPRRATKPSRSARRRRLQGKRRRAQIKKGRGRVRRDDPL